MQARTYSRLTSKHIRYLQGCVRFALQALAVPSASDFAAESFRALCVHGRKQLATKECIEQACHTMMMTT